MLTAANVIADAAGPTVNLSIRYLKPTLIVEQPALFEAWVTSVDERRTHSRGHLIQNGVVTVEAVGEFVHMERLAVEPCTDGTSARKGRRPRGRWRKPVRVRVDRSGRGADRPIEMPVVEDTQGERPPMETQH